MVTSGKNWRSPREDGIELEFPSGNTAKIKPLDIGAYIKIGYVPDILKPVVIKVVSDGSGMLELGDEYENSVEWLKLLDSLVAYAFVDPVVVDEDPYEDNQITVNDVSFRDKVFLFTFFGRPANELSTFRDGQRKLISDMESKQENGESPIGDNEDQRMG